mmetsp:Transcript_43974/g.121683  ORF Transcript_43974/g.121683 Transcript_43974/m.121683 type:complete len:212 (+) Transcript_43974:668-1303(+)
MFLHATMKNGRITGCPQIRRAPIFLIVSPQSSATCISEGGPKIWKNQVEASKMLRRRLERKHSLIGSVLSKMILAAYWLNPFSLAPSAGHSLARKNSRRAMCVDLSPIAPGNAKRLIGASTKKAVNRAPQSTLLSLTRHNRLTNILELSARRCDVFRDGRQGGQELDGALIDEGGTAAAGCCICLSTSYCLAPRVDFPANSSFRCLLLDII